MNDNEKKFNAVKEQGVELTDEKLSSVSAGSNFIEPHSKKNVEAPGTSEEGAKLPD